MEASRRRVSPHSLLHWNPVHSPELGKGVGTLAQTPPPPVEVILEAFVAEIWLPTGRLCPPHTGVPFASGPHPVHVPIHLLGHM